ncbi:MAG: glycosyl hydrolase family protein [Candidatus Saccharibacteria bacterium]|nr:glycosyl hydrolase family protein [Candidatus Saccharibacteria bacterium]
MYQVYEHFNGNSLNYGLWEPITYPKAYRNNEEQDYRPTQVGVADGMLQLHAVRDANGQWHSGEVHSKWNYAYGEFEVRMRVSATGPGVWPAAWLMGTVDQWPNNGEIDIIENVNGSPDAVGTIHGGGSRGHWHTPRWHSPVDIRQFHTYKIVKQPGYISWWVDGVKRGEWYRSQTPAGGVWPFENHRNFGLLNLAIGGNWPGPSNASTPNVTMYVDFFHVKNAY